MTTHIRNTILCLAAVVALVAVTAVPAFAHHKDGHESGQAAEEGTTTEEETTEQEATSGQTESSDDRFARSRTQESNPDPEPSTAPGSTKGPLECPDYSERDNGTYDHDSCDTTSGQHGSEGNGKCAGCTGKADDKSPGGQYRNDNNNGYECDHNGGVGKGNPPHARCPVEPPTIVELCPANSAFPGVPRSSVESCFEDVEGEVVKRCPAGTDRAGKPMKDLEDCDVRGIKDSVLPRVIREAPPATEPNALGAVLPCTGAGDLYFAIALGLLLIVAGSLGMKLRKN